jgi:hypothetical protein
VEMDTVKARVLGPRGCGREIGDDFLHLGVGHRHRRPREDSVRDDGRRQRYDLGYQRLAAGVAQLGEDSTAMPMHRLGDAGERSDTIIVIEAKLSRFVLPARLYVDVAGDDQTGAASR